MSACVRSFDQRLARQIDDEVDFPGRDIEHGRVAQRVLAAMNDGQTDAPQIVFRAVRSEHRSYDV